MSAQAEGIRARRLLAAGLPILPIVVLFGLNCVDELDRTAFALLLPEIRKAFDLSLGGITALTAAIIPASLLFGVPVAYVADRRSRIPIAVAGALAWVVFSVFTGLAPTILLLAAARIGAGLGRAVNDPVHGSLLTDFYPPDVRGRIFGAHRAANALGTFLGPLAAGAIAAALGWRAPFLLLALPTLVFVALALRLAEPPRRGRDDSARMPRFREGFRILARVGTIRRIWFSMPLLSSASIGLAFLLSLYYHDLFGVNVRTRGIILSFESLFTVAGILVGMPLIDHILARDPGAVMRRVGQTGAAMALLVVGLAAAPRLWVGMVFAYLIVALAGVLLAAGFAVVSLVSPPEVKAGGFAYFNVFALLGIVVLPVVGRVGDLVGLRWGIALLAPILMAGGLMVSTAGRFVRADIERAERSAARTG